MTSHNTTAEPASNASALDATDRQLIEATQQGLPLDLHPYQRIAEQLELDESEVIERLQQMMDRGLIRRIGLVPNHYRLGYKYNAMTVWDVPDEQVTKWSRKWRSCVSCCNNTCATAYGSIVNEF